ncbi:DUF1616 domain-containing protein [Halogeometricum sp. S1BR25-6]|uniref:DUF1616 domain-containing protein n=1 Tax=Halogeometricum salsisoli TaxID=2950536 RepID=A0ABU2GJM7_9EURY|nr:DUF1616 domain-containing protein [Halogeometricum sp. S1BR25-6]MDS0300278.1 DUF1616 domain-containing protein [Halogeometricum sp. S1BR25-6]
MSFRERVRPYLPSPVRNLAFDLAALLALLLVTAIAVSIPGIRETPLRAVVSVPFLLFAPGYAFVAALFPEAPDAGGVSSGRSLSHLERLVLSFGSSVALVPLIGFAANFTPWGLGLGPMLAALGSFVFVCVVVASRRRARLSPERRFRPPIESWYRSLRADVFPHETRTDVVLNVALAVALVFAMTGVGYALVDQRNGEQYTELYLLTQGEDKLVADDYPTEFTATESRSLVVGVRNHEHERTSYTVVTKLQRVRSGDQAQGVTVVEEEEIDRFGVTLASNESVRQRRVLTPTLTGDRLRLHFLLYRGDAPADPQANNAYRSAHLWVNVSAPE